MGFDRPVGRGNAVGHITPGGAPDRNCEVYNVLPVKCPAFRKRENGRWIGCEHRRQESDHIVARASIVTPSM
jgi:hypothetical protein